MKLAQWLHAGLTGKREAQQQTSRPVDGILLDDDGDAITLDGHVMHVDADGCLLMGDLDHLLGASTEVVAALPRHTLESTDSLEEGALCTICQSGYQSGGYPDDANLRAPIPRRVPAPLAGGEQQVPPLRAAGLLRAPGGGAQPAGQLQPATGGPCGATGLPLAAPTGAAASRPSLERASAHPDWPRVWTAATAGAPGGRSGALVTDPSDSQVPSRDNRVFLRAL
eukprot:CAMPEP_0204523176 /NCGR_PEP_ID=MMETSP0661-20131031/6709_1 /ASSEMBLY_ACC=CAM_ASM_000606 /TAXON_ID=109239 /ORGANISM="Alexandrium margalefi, Strain AMGDE01CS-322" /LENGTH=224 /DNA_ID=CAMNT_0051528875 /DNA_START=109 /DNA_END=778 /DNA_ORIENTATION=-